MNDFGRIIAVCTAAGIEINAALISEGLAWSFKKYSDDYDQIEKIAQSKKSASGRHRLRLHGNQEYFYLSVITDAIGQGGDLLRYRARLSGTLGMTLFLFRRHPLP